MDRGPAASAVPREKVLQPSRPRGAASAGGQFVPRGKDRKRAFLQPRLARDNAFVSGRSDRSHRRAELASGSLDAGQAALQPAEWRASPPVPSGPLPEARPRLGLRRKPGHSTRLRDFSFTSCAHPAWPGFCFQLTGCWRGILKVQACRSDDRVIVMIQLSRCTLLLALRCWALSSPRPRPLLVQPCIRHEPSPRTVLDMFKCNIV